MVSREGATATGVLAPTLTVVGGFAGAHLLTFGPTHFPSGCSQLVHRIRPSGACSHASRQYSAPQAGDMPAVPVASTQAPCDLTTTRRDG